MSDSYGKYLEERQDYAALCKLLNEEKLPPSADWYEQKPSEANKNTLTLNDRHDCPYLARRHMAIN